MSTHIESTKKQHKLKESEQMIKFLKSQIAWSVHTGQPISVDQYSVFPRALSDENGVSHKSAKSNWTNKLKSRYEHASFFVFITELSWAPNSDYRSNVYYKHKNLYILYKPCLIMLSFYFVSTFDKKMTILSILNNLSTIDAKPQTTKHQHMNTLNYHPNHV